MNTFKTVDMQLNTSEIKAEKNTKQENPQESQNMGKTRSTNIIFLTRKVKTAYS